MPFLLAAILLSGCGSPAPVPVTEIDEIVGTWKSEPLGMAIEILPDGSVPFAVTAGMIERGSYEYMFSFDGGQLTVSGSPGCGDASGSYEVQLLPSGNLDFAVVEDECLIRANGLAGQQVESPKEVEWIKVD